MRAVILAGAALLLCLAAWVGIASWSWNSADMAAIFRRRIEAEAPPVNRFTVLPETVLIGELSDTARLVCGTVRAVNPATPPAEQTYSIVVIKTLFGRRINDGYTPATRPENRAISDQNCAALRAHDAARPR